MKITYMYQAFLSTEFPVAARAVPAGFAEGGEKGDFSIFFCVLKFSRTKKHILAVMCAAVDPASAIMLISLKAGNPRPMYPTIFLFF